MTDITLEQRARELLADVIGVTDGNLTPLDGRLIDVEDALAAIEAALRLSAGADWVVARKHRGSLSDSMETAARISATEAAVREFFDEPTGALLVAPYGWDKRIGWDTHIVTIDGAAVGFTNGPLAAAPCHEPGEVDRG